MHTTAHRRGTGATDITSTITMKSRTHHVCHRAMARRSEPPPRGLWDGISSGQTWFSADSWDPH
ncbi:hypothetical protein GCM10010977_17350 [Citricoccus zhacaiensis]|uniref:Uncharacterized protein n=1 Tax=Citricoccus zhacaiensis TaxID=489142 RepID=A0ABQ2LZY8_9MICC|nr:hypothetical protein GCM10010977_17350 [Citricoccus zhacaiensis]